MWKPPEPRVPPTWRSTTVLIAAAFCMYNRYVDGLNLAARDEALYRERDETTTEAAIVDVDGRSSGSVDEA